MRVVGRATVQSLFPLVILVAVVSCSGDAGGGDTARVVSQTAVETTAAFPVEAPTWLEGTGTVEPLARISPGSRIMGRVAMVATEAGEQVKRGDLLVALDDRDLQATAAAAQAGVKVAEARAQQARLQYERMERLHSRGSATTKEREDAEAAWNIQSAQLEQVRAGVTVARVNLDHARIFSSVDGWVAARMVEVGDMVAPGQILFTLEDLAQVKVVVDIPEKQALRLATGHEAVVIVDGLQREITAAITRVLPAGNAATRTFQVEILLDNPQGALRSGMFVRARFAVDRREVLMVKTGDLVHRGALAGVYVVDADGVARLRWLRLGQSTAGGSEVLAGLQTGERYVTSPPAGLADGTPVSWE